MLGIEPKPSHIVGKFSATELHSWPYDILIQLEDTLLLNIN